MTDKLTIGQYFDLSDFAFADIFTGIDFLWEVLPRIPEYLKTKSNLENYTKKGNILVGEGSKIAKDVVILGPAIIGENCFIGSASLIRENCIIGDNVQIGHAVEIKNSIILNNTAVAHLNYVGDSIVGRNVNISGGAIVANYRLDKHTISINVDGKKINTGLEKFGAIIGDNCVIGVNSVLNPGTILGKNCLVYPLTSVRGVHENNEVIR
jgi:NDP-sugar pyrophosphorylase family protein